MYSGISNDKYIRILFGTFKNCSSNESGGAVFINNVITYWANCIFNDNNARTSGGG
jgi:hypothetical protein